MSRRAHWSFSEYDVFPARITEVGSESDDAGIPHGWQQLVIRTLVGEYADDSVGMYGTVDFNSAYKMDGSAASVGDVVYIRVRGVSQTRGVIFDILDPIVGLRGVAEDCRHCSSDFETAGSSFLFNPRGGSFGSINDGVLFSPEKSAGSDSPCGCSSGPGGSSCGCSSGSGGASCSCSSGSGGSSCSCSSGSGGSSCGCSSHGISSSGDLLSPSSLGSPSSSFSSGDGGFGFWGSLGSDYTSGYAPLFEGPFEFAGSLDAFLLGGSSGGGVGWWSLSGVYDYLESTPLNDYAPGSARFLLLESDGSGVKTITGLSMGQVDSQEVWIKNIGSVDNIVLSWESSGSAAPNRFSNSPSIGSDVLVPGASVLYKYSASLSRWVKMR